jgi:predicted RNase H-like HicB family nuclease
MMLSHVSIEKDEEGWFVAECPALPGCVSQGRDEQEALENIREAIQAWLWAEDQKHLDDSSASGRNQVLVSV